MQQHTVRDVPRLLERLREQVQSETRKPVSAAVTRLSDAIEVAARSGEPEPDSDAWLDYGLSPNERVFADLLWAHFGKPVSIERIMSRLYGARDDAPEPKILNVLACHINKKLVGSPYCIKCVWGTGYRMVEGKYEPRKQERVSWHGISMQGMQAKAAGILFDAGGNWLGTAELAGALGVHARGIGSCISVLRRKLKGSPFAIESQKNHGYRMFLVN